MAELVLDLRVTASRLRVRQRGQPLLPHESILGSRCPRRAIRGSQLDVGRGLGPTDENAFDQVSDAQLLVGDGGRASRTDATRWQPLVGPSLWRTAGTRYPAVPASTQPMPVSTSAGWPSTKQLTRHRRSRAERAADQTRLHPYVCRAAWRNCRPQVRLLGLGPAACCTPRACSARRWPQAWLAYYQTRPYITVYASSSRR